MASGDCASYSSTPLWNPGDLTDLIVADSLEEHFENSRCSDDAPPTLDPSVAFGDSLVMMGEGILLLLDGGEELRNPVEGDPIMADVEIPVVTDAGCLVEEGDVGSPILVGDGILVLVVDLARVSPVVENLGTSTEVRVTALAMTDVEILLEVEHSLENLCSPFDTLGDIRPMADATLMLLLGQSGFSSVHDPDLSLEDVPDLSLDDVPDLSLDDVPEISLDDVPDLSLEDVPDVSLDDVPDLSLVDVPDLSLVDVPDLSLEVVPDSLLEVVPDSSLKVVRDSLLDVFLDSSLENVPSLSLEDVPVLS